MATTDQPPIGQPFTRVYQRPENPLDDRPTFRLRLATLVDKSLYKQHDQRLALGEFMAGDYGLDVPHVGSYGSVHYFFEKHFREAPMPILLDSISAVYRHLIHRRAGADKLWRDEVIRIVVEEHMAYRVDDQCGMHPLVDSAFDISRVSVIAALASAPFKAARQHFDEALAALEVNPPNTRVPFTIALMQRRICSSC
jgi:hypothetical protein